MDARRDGWRFWAVASAALFGRDRWNADELRDLVRAYVVEYLLKRDGVFMIDETGTLKKQSILWSVATIHEQRWKNHQLPNSRIHCLCIAAWRRIHRMFRITRIYILTNSTAVFTVY
jgi:hypothetical protein